MPLPVAWEQDQNLGISSLVGESSAESILTIYWWFPLFFFGGGEGGLKTKMNTHLA